MALLAAYLAAASIWPQAAGRLSGGAYAGWLPLTLWGLLCANLLAATLTRVPPDLLHAGAWCSHLGVLVLAAGALAYAAGAVRGQCAVARTADGWATLREVYREDRSSAYVRGPAPGPAEAHLPPLAWGGEGLQALDVPLAGGPEGVQLRVRGFQDNVSLTAVAELRVRDGADDRRVALAADDPDRYRLDGDGYALMYLPDPPEGLLEGPWPALEEDRAYVVTQPAGPPSALLVARDGTPRRVDLPLGRETELPLAGRTVHVTPLRFYTRPLDERPEAAPPLEAAIVIEAVAGDWTCATFVPFAFFEHLSRPQRLLLPDGRDVRLAFAQARQPLGAEVDVLTAEYTTWPASVVPRDFTCRLRVRTEGDERLETLALNRPVMVGRFQLSQGEWRPDPREPMVLVFSAATRPALPAVWAGCGLVLAGMLFAFYVKPVLARRRGART